MKKLLLFFTVALLAAVSATAQTNPTFSGGKGTADDPFQIACKADILTLAHLTSIGNNCLYTYFRQTADIDMTLADGETFTGIATATARGTVSYRSRYFAGTYDGNGFKISNLNINTVSRDETTGYVKDDNTRCIGLFGAVRMGGTVKNVTLDATCRIEAMGYVGSVVGYMENNATVSNCVSEATVISYGDYAGGIVGTSYTEDDRTGQSITDCLFAGKLLCNGSYAGGIAGKFYSPITGCANYGDITGGPVAGAYSDEDNASKKFCLYGGIAGIFRQSTLSGCANGGMIVTAGYTAGGIVGDCYVAAGVDNATVIRDNINFGIVETYSAERTVAGQIIGDLNSVAMMDVNKCVNNYFDRQIAYHGGCGMDDLNSVPLTYTRGTGTYDFTGGTPLSGLEDHFVFAEDFYPIPKAFAANEIARFNSGAYVILSGGATAATFNTTAELSLAFDNLKAVVPEDAPVEVSGGKISAKNVSAPQNVKFALTDGKYSRSMMMTVTAALGGGDGTEDNPYVITSANDFVSMAQYIELGSGDYKGAHFIVANDIDFTGIENIQAIGNYKNPFQGIVDGQGHTVSNLTISRPEDTDTPYNAIFGRTGKESEIKNLKFSNCHVTGIFNCALVAGLSGGKISNITVDENCSVISMPVYAKPINYASNAAAAIAASGMYSSVITDCTNKAPITGPGYVAGIVGNAFNTDYMAVSNCVNYGKITSNYDNSDSKIPHNYIGGIAASANANADGCVNYGEITANEYVSYIGGIAGSSCKATNCKNYGKVSGGKSGAGGIIGYSNKAVTDCENHAEITGPGQVGGIMGYCSSQYASVTNCVNRANITATTEAAGGIMGYSTGSSTITNCYNTGDITAMNMAAGILGGTKKMNDKSGTKNGVEMKFCFNTGNITATKNCAGGLANGDAHATSCYNAGSIRASKYAGGINGGLYKGTHTIAYCYNVGDIAVDETNKDQWGWLISAYESYAYTSNVNSSYYSNWYTGSYPKNDNRKGSSASPAAFYEKLGDKFSQNGYTINKYALPMLTGLVNDDAKLHASFFRMEHGDKAEDRQTVTTRVFLSEIEGVTWTADGMEIAYENYNSGAPANAPVGTSSYGNNVVDNDAEVVLVARPTRVGEISITAHVGEKSKTYTFTCPKMSGIDDITGDSAANPGDDADAVYYNLQGIRVSNPEKGQVYIRVLNDKALKVRM